MPPSRTENGGSSQMARSHKRAEVFQRAPSRRCQRSIRALVLAELRDRSPARRQHGDFRARAGRGRSPAPYTARDVEPLHIADRSRRHVGELGAADVIAEQLLHRGEPPPDRHRGEQRALHPAAEHSPAHRGFGLIEHPEKAAALFAGAQVFRQLEIAPRRGVKLHIPAPREDIRHAQLRRCRRAPRP